MCAFGRPLWRHVVDARGLGDSVIPALPPLSRSWPVVKSTTTFM